MTRPIFWLAIDERTGMARVYEDSGAAIMLEGLTEATVVYEAVPYVELRDVTKELAELFHSKLGVDGMPEAYRQFYEDEYHKWMERTT